ncbi:MAG: arsenite methyltransferase [Planctomycetes bacterium]|nr:arsenite methyltransferase [Planctomycetota bacterium]
MSTNQEVRDTVSEFYAGAVKAPAESGGSCCGPTPKGVVAKIADYTPDELAALPPDAVANAFGCGNPLAFSEVKPGQIVLDLGSGAGIDILLAAKKVGPTGRAIGVDMTDEMIAKANENIAASGLANVEARKGTIEDLPVESASVDWVISNCVINLSPEKPKVFAEIARVLKPGGRMLVSDIVVHDLPDRIKTDKHLYNACVAGALSEEEYLRGLRAAGLEDADVRDRIVYDVSQLEAFIRSDLPEDAPGGDATAASCGCGGTTSNTAIIGDVARAVVGKVWSAKIHARKPG